MTNIEAVEFNYKGERRRAIFYGEQFEGRNGKLTQAIDVDKNDYRTFRVSEIKGGQLVKVPLTKEISELLEAAAN